MRHRETALTIEDTVGNRPVHLEDFREPIPAEVVLVEQILEQVEPGAGREFFDVIRIVALNERRQQLKIIRLIGVELWAGNRENVNDLDGIVVARTVVDGAGRMEPDQPVEGGGQAGKALSVER